MDEVAFSLRIFLYPFFCFVNVWMPIAH